jgi:hypothetical protein
MLFDPKKPVQTRNGRPARILCADAKGAFPIIALLTMSDGSEAVNIYYAEGNVRSPHESAIHPFDLVNVPEKRTITVRRWLIVYNDGTTLVCCEPPALGSREGDVFAIRELNITETLIEGEGLPNG